MRNESISETEKCAQEVGHVGHLGFDLQFNFNLALCFKSSFVVSIMD